MSGQHPQAPPALAPPPPQPQVVSGEREAARKGHPARNGRLGLGVLGTAAAVGLAVALAVLRGGTGSPGTPAAPATTYAIGQTASVRNWDLTVTRVDRPGLDLIWSTYRDKAAAAGTWYVVAVTLTNTGGADLGVNDRDFTLHDGGGATYAITDKSAARWYARMRGSTTPGDPVPPGVAVRYLLIFDIDPAATGLTVTFNQGKEPVFKLD